MHKISDPSAFVGNVPHNYDAYMVPMFMQPYADDLAERTARLNPVKILETAAGTGVLTEALREQLPQAEIVATDLNEDMLSRAKSSRPDLNVVWQACDATDLPFPDKSFDAVAMQYGYMFMPDKQKGLDEAFRVLRAGGTFLFNVWESVSKNDLARTCTETLTDEIEPGPPSFLNVPFGSYDKGPILEQLRAAGFDDIRATNVPKECRSESALGAATGLVEGSPLYGAIVEHGKDANSLREKVAKAFAEKFGESPNVSRMEAIVFEARKPG